MKKVKIIALVSYFTMFSMILSADNNITKTELNEQVITALYNQLKEADSDIDSGVLSDLQTMQNDGIISIKELREEFDDLIDEEFISNMHKNLILDKSIQYTDASNQKAIDEFLAKTNKTLAEAKKASKRGEEASKRGEEYKDLAKRAREVTKKLGG